MGKHFHSSQQCWTPFHFWDVGARIHGSSSSSLLHGFALLHGGESQWCLRGVKGYGKKVGIAIFSETVSNTVFLAIATCLLKDLTGWVTGELILLERRVIVICCSSSSSSNYLATGLTHIPSALRLWLFLHLSGKFPEKSCQPRPNSQSLRFVSSSNSRKILSNLTWGSTEQSLPLKQVHLFSDWNVKWGLCYSPSEPDLF